MERGWAERWRAADWHVELSIGLIVAVVSAVGAWVDDPSDPGRAGWWPATVAAASGLVLVVRRVAPLTVLAAVLALLGVVALQGHQVGTTTVALLFAGHAVGRWAPGVRAWIGLGAMWTLFVVLALTEDPYFSQPVAVLAPVIYAMPFLLGRFLARRAAQAEADVDAAQEASRLSERALIARELHDIVTHALTGISVHAAAARHLGTQGAEAGEAFAHIEVLSRQALGDLRRMLDLLREDPEVPSAPSPGLGDLADLVSGHRAVHGPVDLEVQEPVGGLERSVGLAVYRVVQEALTNVARHARGAPATVRVRPAPDDVGTVWVTVADAGAGPEPDRASPRSSGRSFGLAGMRERVSVFGGTLEAGPLPDGGFRVHAEIPVSG